MRDLANKCKTAKAKSILTLHPLQVQSYCAVLMHCKGFKTYTKIFRLKHGYAAKIREMILQYPKYLPNTYIIR
jgi:hypothetical protein